MADWTKVARLIRIARGDMTVSAAAHAAGVSRGWWQNVEKGSKRRNQPEAAKLAAAVRAVGADLSEVFTAAGYDPEPFKGPRLPTPAERAALRDLRLRTDTIAVEMDDTSTEDISKLVESVRAEVDEQIRLSTAGVQANINGLSTEAVLARVIRLDDRLSLLVGEVGSLAQSVQLLLEEELPRLKDAVAELRAAREA